VCDGDAVGEDTWRLAVGEGVGEGDVTGFALVIPAVHAARDRPAAQDVTVKATKRYEFIKCLSVGLVAASSKLGRHLAAGIAALSRFCDSGRSPGTALHR
jgi:phosphohistidine swiveling domain-containing protein